jgi:hypothetical protein
MTGTGKVFKGREFVAEVQYEHSTSQNYEQGQRLDGPYRVLTSKEVRLRITPASEISPYFGADMLTLQMSDGQKQNFFVMSPDGECRATGGPY